MQDLILPDFLVSDPNQRYIVDYLYKLVEQLEFALNNISVDNLSDSLAEQIKALGVSVRKSSTTATEAQQKSAKTLTVSDVINSAQFQADQIGQFDQDNGIIIIQDDTMICYGKVNNGTSVTFPETYAAVPCVITTPETVPTATKNGFSVAESATFDYICIGRKEKIDGN